MMQFPGTNFHDLNLDWVIDQVKTMITEWATTREDWDELSQDHDALRAEWTQFQEDMRTWLNTQVPAEIADQLMELVNDDTIYNIILNGDSEHPAPIAAAVQAWLNSHIAITEGYVVDDTLAIEGAAADAKATGDAVRVTLPFNIGIWEYGNLSQTGNGSQTGQHHTIRTPDPPFYDFPRRINYSVPEGYQIQFTTVNAAGEAVTPQTWLSGTGTYEFNSAAVKFRIRLWTTNHATTDDIPMSVAEAVQITYDVTIGDYLAERVEAINPDYTDFSMVTDFGVIGDSWASGSLHYKDVPDITSYPQSWPQILARKSGARAINFSRGGLTTKTWLANTVGLQFLLSNDPLPLYIINLGINDNTEIQAGRFAVGTIDDVHVDDFTQNPDTFFGDYGKIIGNIKAHAPNAKIICVSVMRWQERANMDTRIGAIANKYGIPFINLAYDDYFNSRTFYNAVYDGHPVAYGYGGIANRMGKLICKTILSDRKYWMTYKPFGYDT